MVGVLYGAWQRAREAGIGPSVGRKSCQSTRLASCWTLHCLLPRYSECGSFFSLSEQMELNILVALHLYSNSVMLTVLALVVVVVVLFYPQLRSRVLAWIGSTVCCISTRNWFAQRRQYDEGTINFDR